MIAKGALIAKGMLSEARPSRVHQNLALSRTDSGRDQTHILETSLRCRVKDLGFSPRPWSGIA